MRAVAGETLLCSALQSVQVVLIVLTFIPVGGTELQPVDELIERLREPDPAVWKETVEQLGSRRRFVVPQLIHALEDPHRAVREGAAHALGDIGPDAADAVDALIRAFEDEDDFVRWKAARALGRIGPAAKKAIPVLQPSADNERETEVVRATAQRALEQIRGSR